MNGIEPPKIIIYLPLDEQDTHDALVEFTAAGATLRPGHPSYPCNTRLSVVARAALKGAVPESSLDDIIGKIDGGHLTLENLDDIAERGAPDLSGLSLVYESTQPDEITLRFLSDDGKDEDLLAKGAIADLKRLASEEHGVDLGVIEDIALIRSRMGGYIYKDVMGEFIQGNAKPLVKLLAATFALGEVYNWTRTCHRAPGATPYCKAKFRRCVSPHCVNKTKNRVDTRCQKTH